MVPLRGLARTITPALSISTSSIGYFARIQPVVDIIAGCIAAKLEVSAIHTTSAGIPIQADELCPTSGDAGDG
jgi:hypothetical protein